MVRSWVMRYQIDGIPFAHVAVRVLWIVVRLVLAGWLSQHGSRFFYQGF